MNRDAPTPQLSGCPGILRRSHLIVVDDGSRANLPDLDSEAVGTPAARQLPIDGGEQEPVTTAPVDRTSPFELSARTRHHQPLVSCAGEVELAGVILKFGVAGRQ